MSNDTPSLRSRDVADELGVSVRTVHREVARGTLTPTLVVPGHRGIYLWSRNDLDKQLADWTPTGYTASHPSYLVNQRLADTG